MTVYKLRPPTVEAVQVKAVDFNMHLLQSEDISVAWDGKPFSDAPDWLITAIKNGDIWISPESSSYDYCVWSVKTTDNRTYLAHPGDYIVYEPDPYSFSYLKVMDEEKFNRRYEPA